MSEMSSKPPSELPCLRKGRAVKKGREEGRAEGRAETLRKAIRALQKSLGQNVTPLEELQSLSLDELESLWEGLSNDGK
ncbi:MAG TPA: hypothetical protein VFI31_15785 [Pirellulales bacterium]|nr:hypothetical protein [Pirellulales bacterium]